MEFKFRAVDPRPPVNSSSSSSSAVGYFSRQPLRAGYSTTDPKQDPDPEMLSRYETLRREIVKDRIREEIIAAEIVRRRMLEAEVRRELMMMEQPGISLEEKWAMLMSLPTMSWSDSCLVEDRLGFLGASGFFNLWPASRPQLRLQSEGLTGPQVMPALGENKDKVIVLANPNPNLRGSKRKAATPPASGNANELPLIGIKKKRKEEWSCALCQVSATSERSLNEHLQGKKHKAKKSALRAENMAKNSSSVPPSIQIGNQARLVSSTRGLQLKERIESQPIEVDKSDAILDKNVDKEQVENKSDELLALRTQQADENRKETVQREEADENRKETARREEEILKSKEKKFKFWCEMCQIGAYSEVVMVAHQKGKKHIARLQGNGQNGEAIVTTATTNTIASPKDGEKANISNELAETAVKNETESVVGCVNATGSYLDDK